MTPRHEIYIPGHLPQKLGMLAFGLILLALGLSQLLPPLWMLTTGTRVDARAHHVIKEKTGLPEVRLENPAAVEAGIERFDRSYRFWNTFLIERPGESPLEVRLPSPAVLRPAFPLLDTDGLPTLLPVVINPSDPTRVVFPTVFSTWVFPALLSLIGFLTSAAAALLAASALKPIEMPIVHSHEEPPEK
jgi:hypothetical protein